MKAVVGVLFDVERTGTAKAHTVKTDSLQGYYDALNCSLFDITTRKIGEHFYDIYCDDEGLLKCNPIVSAIDSDGAPALVGNLFVVKHNEEGETISLTESQIHEVIDNVAVLCGPRGMYIALICDI